MGHGENACVVTCDQRGQDGSTLLPTDQQAARVAETVSHTVTTQSSPILPKVMPT